MTAITLRNGALRRIAAAFGAVLLFLINPLGWRQRALIRLKGEYRSPRVQLTRNWYLDATREPISAELLLEVNRYGRRRCRIVNRKGYDLSDVRANSFYVSAQRWVATGDEEFLKRGR